MRPHSGAIVNLSSIVGHKAPPGAPLYVASKHAVEGLTKASALEAAAFGVRVTAVAPARLNRHARSLCRQQRRCEGRPACQPAAEARWKPDEITRGIMFAASDAASYMTGCILAVDGGMTVD